MKTNKLIFILLSFITFSFIYSSCHDDLYRLESYLIKVDSIHVPDAISSSTPFDIEFFGTVGTDGCHNFTSFTKSFNNNDLIIEAWGSFDYKSEACPTVMVYLDGQKLSVIVPNPGIYNIKIKQPDNTFLVRQITVK